MLARSPKVTLYTGGSDGFVAFTAAPIATEWNEPVLGRDFHPQWTSAFHGARRTWAKARLRPFLGSVKKSNYLHYVFADTIRSQDTLTR